MTGAELKQLRTDLGDAIGRRLSVADMAKIVGLAPANGAETWRKWEDGAGPSGPVAALMSVLSYASDRHPIPPLVGSAGGRLMPRPQDDDAIEAAEEIFRSMLREEVRRRLG